MTLRSFRKLPVNVQEAGKTWQGAFSVAASYKPPMLVTRVRSRPALLLKAQLAL
jgi:hypothetical protein